MAIGLGIVLIVLGLVLVSNVISYDIPHVDDHSLGLILLVAGVLAVVLSLVINAQRSRRVHRTVEEVR